MESFHTVVGLIIEHALHLFFKDATADRMTIMEKLKAAWLDYWPEDQDRPRVRWDCVHTDSEPTFDPMLGFPNGRKIRESVATRQEVIDSQIELKDRDYCAHKWIAIFACMQKAGALRNMMGHCNPLKHEWQNCEYEDYVLRFKEYERERRLRERQKRRIAMGLEPDPKAASETM